MIVIYYTFKTYSNYTNKLNKPVAISAFDNTKPTNISETKCMAWTRDRGYCRAYLSLWVCVYREMN